MEWIQDDDDILDDIEADFDNGNRDGQTIVYNIFKGRRATPSDLNDLKKVLDITHETICRRILEQELDYAYGYINGVEEGLLNVFDVKNIYEPHERQERISELINAIWPPGVPGKKRPVRTATRRTQY